MCGWTTFRSWWGLGSTPARRRKRRRTRGFREQQDIETIRVDLAKLHAAENASDIRRETETRALVEICLTRKHRYKSDALAAIHSNVGGMYRSRTIDKATMRRFDDSCLVAPRTIEPSQIKQLRESNNVSQPVFARYLNPSDSTCGKVGIRRQAAERHGSQALGDRQKARFGSAHLKFPGVPDPQGAASACESTSLRDATGCLCDDRLSQNSSTSDCRNARA